MDLAFSESMSFEIQRKPPVKRPLSGKVIRSFQIQVPKVTNEQKNSSAEEGRVCWYYTAQFFSQLVSQRWRKKSIASCKRHVTRCNLSLQVAMVSKNFCSRCTKQKRFLLCVTVPSPKSCETSRKEGMLHPATYTSSWRSA